MAFSRWVVNASPLILLGKTGQIGLLSALADRIAVPQAVAEEVSAGDDGRTTLQAIMNDPVFILVENEAPSRK